MLGDSAITAWYCFQACVIIIKHILTVGAMLGSYYQLRALHWYHFTGHKFTWPAKCSLENRPVDISQWKH